MKRGKRNRGRLRVIEGGKADPVRDYRWPVPCRCGGTGIVLDKRGVRCVCVACGLARS